MKIRYFRKLGERLVEKMGNIISFNHTVKINDDSLAMSNGLTDVLIDYLLLSGSELAETDSEKDLIVYIAEKQQSIIGIGNVDFSIVDMPWVKETFETDKRFLLRVVKHANELAIQNSVWEMMGYMPDIYMLDRALLGFKMLVKRMTVDDVVIDEFMEFLKERDGEEPLIVGYQKCPKHGVYMSYLGCKFCNDGV